MQSQREVQGSRRRSSSFSWRLPFAQRQRVARMIDESSLPVSQDGCRMLPPSRTSSSASARSNTAADQTGRQSESAHGQRPASEQLRLGKRDHDWASDRHRCESLEAADQRACGYSQLRRDVGRFGEPRAGVGVRTSTPFFRTRLTSCAKSWHLQGRCSRNQASR